MVCVTPINFDSVDVTAMCDTPTEHYAPSECVCTGVCVCVTACVFTVTLENYTENQGQPAVTCHCLLVQLKTHSGTDISLNRCT